MKQLSDETRLFAALAYLPVLQPIIPILFVLLKPEDKFIKFHSIQALALFGAGIVIGFVLTILTAIIGALTFGIGLILLMPIFMIGGFGILVLYIYLMYKAWQGEKYKLPTIGDWAESFQ